MRSIAGRKDANEQMTLVIISLMVAVPIMIIFINVSVSFDQQYAYLMDFYSKDLPLIVEALQAVPGDSQVSYVLEDGFTAEVVREKLIIAYPSKSKEVNVDLHLLPGTDFPDAKAQRAIILTKQGSTITMGVDTPTLAASSASACPESLLFKGKSIVVSIGALPFSESGATLSSDDLGAVKASFEAALQAKGIPTSPTGGPDEVLITLSFSARPLESGRSSVMTITHSQGVGDETAAYAAILCSFRSDLKGASVPLQEFVTQDSAAGLPLAFSFDMKSSERETFLSERGQYAEAFASSVGRLSATPAGGASP